MSSILRLLAGLSLCVVILAVAGRLAAPCLLRELGLDWWNLTEQYRQQLAEQDRAAAMSQFDAVLLRRIGMKTEITKRVIARELSLREAAVRFRKISTWPAPDEESPQAMGAEEGEKWCNQVLSWVRSELCVLGQREDPLVASLEADLAQLRNTGALELLD